MIDIAFPTIPEFPNNSHLRSRVNPRVLALDETIYHHTSVFKDSDWGILVNDYYPVCSAAEVNTLRAIRKGRYQLLYSMLHFSDGRDPIMAQVLQKYVNEPNAIVEINDELFYTTRGVIGRDPEDDTKLLDITNSNYLLSLYNFLGAKRYYKLLNYRYGLHFGLVRQSSIPPEKLKAIPLENNVVEGFDKNTLLRVKDLTNSFV